MRVSPRFLLFVFSLASFLVAIISTEFLWSVILYLSAGILWLLHVKTLPFGWQTGGIALKEGKLFPLLVYILMWPLASYSAAQDRIERLSSRERFLVSRQKEIRRFRRWMDAVECARHEADETKEKAAIQDTGRYEWRAPWYDIWVTPRVLEERKLFAAGTIASPQLAAQLEAIRREYGNEKAEIVLQWLENKLTSDAPWGYPLYFVEPSGRVSRSRLHRHR